jgi:hypothetical protein
MRQGTVWNRLLLSGMMLGEPLMCVRVSVCVCVYVLLYVQTHTNTHTHTYCLEQASTERHDAWQAPDVCVHV